MHEQAVLLRIKLADNAFGEYDEREAVYAIEDRLRTALAMSSSGECDGHEFGVGFATIYCYGSDANGLLADCFRIFGDQEFPPGSHFIVRSGPPGAQELRVELRQYPAV